MKEGLSDVFSLIVDNAAWCVKSNFFKKRTDPGIKSSEKEKTKKKGWETNEVSGYVLISEKLAFSLLLFHGNFDVHMIRYNPWY